MPAVLTNYIIKNYQFTEFFKYEMMLYAHSPIVRRKLIQELMKGKNVKEYKLTPMDILEGFKSTGIYKGYSEFNPGWSNWFVTHYNIKSVYDPCGGFGEHLLGMLSCDRIIYNDSNLKVCENVVQMANDFNINQVEVNCNDSTEFVPDDVDAWFTCPPYYVSETYQDKLFKDINEYKTFLNKIINLWKSSNSRLFGMVLREDFINLIDITPSESHKLNVLNPYYDEKSGKYYKDKIYIFKKEYTKSNKNTQR